MSFAYPAALVALAVVPLLLLAYVLVQRRRARYALRFTNLALLANVVDRSPRWRRHVPAALVLAALAALLVAVARPQTAHAVQKKEGTVVLAIDRSGSMLATDVSPTRMAAARAAAAQFVKGLPSTFKVGLVSFSDQADVELQPTTNHAEAIRALGTLQADNGTALGDALAKSVDLGLTSLNEKANTNGTPLVVLLLSDGANTTGDVQPLDAAAQAAKAKVPVYTIALGTDAGTITTTSPNGDVHVYRVPPDPATLQAIASKTGGRSFEAADAATLKTVYDRIGTKVGTTIEHRELSSVFAAGGAVFLLLGSAASLAWFNRLP